MSGLRWQRYGDGGRKSGVTRYALAPGAIHVQFHDNRVYVYDSDRPGLDDVRAMQALAKSGSGLSTYISQRVQQRYARSYRV